MSILRSHRVGAVLFCIGVCGPGCSGNVARGHALYADGYYVEAAEVFERNERRISEWPPQKRATYGLYRGMTLLQLGDLQGAARWLAYARWISSEYPGALPQHEAALLDQSQHSLADRLGRPTYASPPEIMADGTPGAPPSGAPAAGAPASGTSQPGAPAPQPASSGPERPAPTRKSFTD